MAHIFPRWVNRVPVALLVAIFGVLGPLGTLIVWYYFSPEFTDVGYQPAQPIEYSHALHVGELAIDCRYCHAQVERSAVATVPPSKVCMNCHSLVKRDSPMLAVLRDSIENGRPIRWVRIHNVPDYAFFDHSIHVRAGVGCQSCHGEIHTMEVVAQEEPLSMAWCLDCHRDPEPHLRPRDQITNMQWRPADDHATLAAQWRDERGLAPPEDCTACHR